MPVRVSLGFVSVHQVKRRKLLDLRGNIPTFIHISDGKMHDVNVLDILIPEAGDFYIMDRGYLDFTRLFSIDQASAFFIIRAKSNTVYRRRYSHAVTTEEKLCGVRCDQTIMLTGIDSKNDYPQQLRRIKCYDSKTDKTFNFLTNDFSIRAQTVADLYRYRWQVELFFKWIKQHLRIKSFFGTSENAVKSQIWIAISVYVLVAIIKKRIGLKLELYTILQILSLTLFEKTPLDQLLMNSDNNYEIDETFKQLNLFNLTLGH
ncbi:MAG: transposase [Parvicella sp.]